MERSAALLLAAVALGGCAGLHGSSHEVRFTSRDGVELAGTLVLPDGARHPLPGVVLLHGAEAATRSMAYRMHANVFVDHGMAVLLYDKRGAGESGGDHESATFAQLIDDALAAVEFLRGRDEVDGERVGLVGASQSGWLTPEIAERAGGISFVINKVGPCGSWRETNAWEVYNDLLADGASEADARAQSALFDRMIAWLIDPEPGERAALEAELRAWAERSDALPATLPTLDEDDRRDIAYDPSPFLEREPPPMLYVYGSEDVNVPTAACVRRLTALRDAGRPVSFHVFEGEGHELGGVGLRGYRFADGYAELLGDFATANLERRR